MKLNKTKTRKYIEPKIKIKKLKYVGLYNQLFDVDMASNLLACDCSPSARECCSSPGACCGG